MTKIKGILFTAIISFLFLFFTVFLILFPTQKPTSVSATTSTVQSKGNLNLTGLKCEYVEPATDAFFNDHITFTNVRDVWWGDDPSTPREIVSAQNIGLEGTIEDARFYVRYGLTDKYQYILDSDIYPNSFPKGSITCSLYSGTTLLKTTTVSRALTADQQKNVFDLGGLSYGENYTVKYHLTFLSSYDVTRLDIWQYDGEWEFNFHLTENFFNSVMLQVKDTETYYTGYQYQDGVYYTENAWSFYFNDNPTQNMAASGYYTGGGILQ